MDGLSEGQFRALVVTERISACLSLISIFFVIGTYLLSPHFKKPINRLIFFASIGNIGSDIAALISEDGPMAGRTSPLCQVQAFLFQMFLGVDCLWAFCMAINVYLVFFRGYSVQQLRRLDIKYLFFCYGISFLPSFVFLWISSPHRGRIYGPAVIWCWITVEWDFMRLIFLYGWIWIAIMLATCVYVRAVFAMYRKRKYLRGFLNPLNENPFANTITTDIEITREIAPPRPPSERGLHPEASLGYRPYTVNVDIDKNAKPSPTLLRIPTLTREAANDQVNPEAWLYARVAILFFIALLITWVPTSVNRLYDLVNPNDLNFPLNYAASLVFPLQGFWNLIVYLVTSKTACRNLACDIKNGILGRKSAAEGLGLHRTSTSSVSDDRIKLTEAGSTFK